MLTLALDTSSRTGSVALLSDRKVLVEFTFQTNANHAETLLPVIRFALSHSRVAMKDIDVLALTTGPGSFTGLRIGASTVKGLALPGGKPVAAVSTLEALALNGAPCRIDICPMLDARKKEIYTALYRTGADGLPEIKEIERVTDPADFISRLTEEVLFLGDALETYEGLIRHLCPVKAHFAPEHLRYVRASAVGLLGLEKYRRGQTVDLLTFGPRYLRLSQAEAGRKDTRPRGE